jgi:hypothetical protein
MGGQVRKLALVEVAVELHEGHQHIGVEKDLENPEDVVG